MLEHEFLTSANTDIAEVTNKLISQYNEQKSKLPQLNTDSRAEQHTPPLIPDVNEIKQEAMTNEMASKADRVPADSTDGPMIEEHSITANKLDHKEATHVDLEQTLKSVLPFENGSMKLNVAITIPSDEVHASSSDHQTHNDTSESLADDDNRLEKLDHQVEAMDGVHYCLKELVCLPCDVYSSLIPLPSLNR